MVWGRIEMNRHGFRSDVKLIVDLLSFKIFRRMATNFVGFAPHQFDPEFIGKLNKRIDKPGPHATRFPVCHHVGMDGEKIEDQVMSPTPPRFVFGY
jgi:hypothetical protein